MDMVEKLRWRYTTKIFDAQRKISDEGLEALKESLRLSPSSFGLQPWKFVVVNSKDLRQKLKEHAWGQSQITEASHLIVLCVLTDLDEKNVGEYIDYTAKVRNIDKSKLEEYRTMMVKFVKGLSKEEKKSWMKRQLYIALGTLMATAASMGIDSCPIEGFNSGKFDEVLGLEKYGAESVVLCALGYRSKDDKNASLKKVRYPDDKIFIKM